MKHLKGCHSSGDGATCPDCVTKRACRKIGNARREIRKAVERFGEIDPLAGHRAEAVRQARGVRDAAHEAVRRIEAMG